MDTHIIGRYSFDITCDARPRAVALQDMVSGLFRQNISAGTESLLQQLIPADMMASVDTLVLDIGKIPLKDLETELPEKILAALQQALSDLLHHHHSSGRHQLQGNITIRKGDERLLELLSFLLLHGVMPWWATTAERAQPGDMVLHLSDTSPGRLAAFLRNIARSQAVRERIVWQFPVTVLQAIVEVLEPAEALFIIASSREILLLQRQQQLLHTETSELEKAVWLFMLTYLIMERGSNFNRKEFVRSNLLQLASHFNLAYETVIALFYEALSRYQPTLPQTGLANYIRSLYEEITPSYIRKRNFPGDTTPNNLMSDTGEQIHLLRYYLLYGAIPWWAPGVTPQVLEQLLHHACYHAPAPLKQMLQAVLQQQPAATRWQQLLHTGSGAAQQPAHLNTIKIWAEQVISTASYSVRSNGKQTYAHNGMSVADINGKQMIPGDGNASTGADGKQTALRDGNASTGVDGKQTTIRGGNATTEADGKQTAPGNGKPGNSVNRGLLLSSSNTMEDNGATTGNTMAAASFRAGFNPSFANDNDAPARLLRDVILHLLTYGSIPWWGKTYAHFSLNSLLQQLADQQPGQTLTILEYAGTLPDAMYRLINAVTPSVFFRLLQYRGLHTVVEEVYDNLYMLLSAVQQLVNVSTLPQEQLVLQAIWQSLAATRYRQIDKEILLQRLLMPAWSQAPVAAPHMISFLAQQLLPVIRHLSGNTILAGDLQQWTDKRAEKLTAATRERLPVPPGASPAMVVAWLQQFLLSGQLPAAAGETDSVYAAALLQWLYEYHREYITTLQRTIVLSPTLFQQLEELYLRLEPEVAPIQALLQPWLEKTIASSGVSVTTGNSRAYRPAVAFRSLLQRMERYTAITAESQQQVLLDEATALLTVFLTRHRLPEKLGQPTTSATNEIIKAAVILLFHAAPTVLQQLFSSHRQQLQARLQIYGLFSFYAGPPDSQVRRSLDVFAIPDSLLLLQETGGHTVADNITDLRKAVHFYKQRSRHERKLFYSKILQHTALIEQMAEQLNDESFLDMMQDVPLGWSSHTTDALHELQHLLASLLPGSQEKMQLQQLFRRFHLLLLGAHIHVYNAASYAARLLDFITTTAPGIAALLISGLVKALGAAMEQPRHDTTLNPGELSPTHLRKLLPASAALSRMHIRNILPALQQEALRLTATTRHQALLRESLYEKDRLQTSPPKTAAKPVSPDIAPRETDSWAKMKKQPMDTIYTDNAGLIILHPFIPYGFKRIGLVNDDGFVNKEAQHRAVHLLQYMVTGKEVHAEHDLPLNKILCALPLEEPVPAEIWLTAEEKQLCEELLKVVIQRWEKMNNSSVEGFRAAFLQREGALWQKDDDWWLRIEERGYDMILQTLPWGIGMIKAPWMEKTIYTEWAYS